jgi:hypothetical protein
MPEQVQPETQGGEVFALAGLLVPPEGRADIVEFAFETRQSGMIADADCLLQIHTFNRGQTPAGVRPARGLGIVAGH